MAICGRSGRYGHFCSTFDTMELTLISNYSGKSSLVLSLLRMAVLKQGSVLVDDEDICTIPSDTIRSAFNVVPQDPVLVPGSIRLNLDPNDQKSDSDIISILTRLSLWDIISSRGNLASNIDMIPFSQGQKQLFCFARSILSNADKMILILDESTSNIDFQTETLVLDMLDEFSPHHTIVAVAHRLETVVRYDKIAVLDSGKLIEWDSPSNLLASEDGAFKALWDSHCMLSESQT